MTTNEILIETVRFYSEDTARRAVSVQGGCAYRVPPKPPLPERCCAVGRCMTPEALGKYGSHSGFVNILVNANEGGDVDNILRPEYHGHDIKFWYDLQVLHDTPQNWSNKYELAKFIESRFGENALQAVRDAGLL